MYIKLRNLLLDRTDWTQVADNDLTAEEKTAWQVYRQALRDLQDGGFGEWPTPPGVINFADGIPEWVSSIDAIRAKIIFN